MAQVAHELRNSLGTVRTALHVLETSPRDSPAHEPARTLIGRQVAQMSLLVDDLLDVSRVRNGRLQLRRGRIDLCVVLAQAMHTVEWTIQRRGHRLSASFPETPVWLQGDGPRLEQVFVNLLMNAAKYTDAGGDVHVTVTQNAGQAVVVISDNGIGIAADVLPTIFELYVQAGPSSRHGGLGLGLPLVRGLVESHGGSVTAASGGIGHGSEFTVRLPVFASA